MECIKILKKLNERKVKGYKYLTVKVLTEKDIQNILECGYFVKKIQNEYRISDDNS